MTTTPAPVALALNHPPISTDSESFVCGLFERVTMRSLYVLYGDLAIKCRKNTYLVAGLVLCGRGVWLEPFCLETLSARQNRTQSRECRSRAVGKPVVGVDPTDQQLDVALVDLGAQNGEFALALILVDIQVP